MTEPPILLPRYDDATLEADRLRAVELFREERLEEPVDEYPALVDEYQGVVEELLEATLDLTRLREDSAAVFADPRRFEAFRYLAGPPISEDDLALVADVPTLVPASLAADPAALARVLDVVWQSIDRRRFAWAVEGREPTETERQATVLASAALIAAQRIQTQRWVLAQDRQVRAVAGALEGAGFAAAATRRLATMAAAPPRGAYYRAAPIGRRTIDFAVRMRDDRLLTVECKSSSSYTNSVKRLVNDTATKAVAWRRALGDDHLVSAVVLSGAYKLRNLRTAQDGGLVLFWEHRLDVLAGWLRAIR